MKRGWTLWIALFLLVASLGTLSWLAPNVQAEGGPSSDDDSSAADDGSSDDGASDDEDGEVPGSCPCFTDADVAALPVLPESGTYLRCLTQANVPPTTEIITLDANLVEHGVQAVENGAASSCFFVTADAIFSLSNIDPTAAAACRTMIEAHQDLCPPVI